MGRCCSGHSGFGARGKWIVGMVGMTTTDGGAFFPFWLECQENQTSGARRQVMDFQVRNRR
jgi:hypothetical protein